MEFFGDLADALEEMPIRKITISFITTIFSDGVEGFYEGGLELLYGVLSWLKRLRSTAPQEIVPLEDEIYSMISAVSYADCPLLAMIYCKLVRCSWNLSFRIAVYLRL